MIEGKKVIDAHTHIYPAKIAAKAIAGTGKFYGIAPNELDGSPDTLLREDRMGGIDLSLVCSVATTPRQVSSINRYLASVAAEYPGQIEAIGTLHPESEDQSADVEEAVSLGLRGVKLHPDIQGFRLDDERCMEIFALCEGRLPVLLHTGDKRYDYSNPNRLTTVLRAFPRLQVVGAHFGCYTVWEQAGELRDFENLAVDCSSSLMYLTRERTDELLDLYGSERVLFGTDYPMWHPSEEIRRFLELKLPGETEEKILHKNAERVFGL